MSYEALKKRFDQGWVCEMVDDLEKLVVRVKEAKKNKEVSKFPQTFFKFWGPAS